MQISVVFPVLTPSWPGFGPVLALTLAGCTPTTRSIENPPTAAQITANQFIATANEVQLPNQSNLHVVGATGKVSMEGAVVIYESFHPPDQWDEKRPTAIVGQSTISVDFDGLSVTGNARNFAEVVFQTENRAAAAPYSVVAVNNQLDGQLAITGTVRPGTIPGSVNAMYLTTNGTLTGQFTDNGVSQSGTITVNTASNLVSLYAGPNYAVTNGQVTGLTGYGANVEYGHIVFSPDSSGPGVDTCNPDPNCHGIQIQHFYQQVD